MFCILALKIKFNQKLLNDVILINRSWADLVDLTIEQILGGFIFSLAISQPLQFDITRIAIKRLCLFMINVKIYDCP